jgi:hypothetical protein
VSRRASLHPSSLRVRTRASCTRHPRDAL